MPVHEAEFVDIEAGQGANVVEQAAPSRRAPSSSCGLPNLNHLNLEPLDPNTNLDDINIDLSG